MPNLILLLAVFAIIATIIGINIAKKKKRINKLPIISLSLVLLGFIGGFTLIPGIIIGHVALYQIEKSQDKTGDKLTKASLFSLSYSLSK